MLAGCKILLKHMSRSLKKEMTGLRNNSLKMPKQLPMLFPDLLKKLKTELNKLKRMLVTDLLKPKKTSSAI